MHGHVDVKQAPRLLVWDYVQASTVILSNIYVAVWVKPFLIC
jgi:hypothetical protein